MRIDDVNKAVEAFQQLSYQDVDAATKSVNDLFRLLLKRDKFYVIGQAPDVLLAPIQENSDRPYLRVFTHQELASKHGETEKITSLELCRLCRHWFCRGVPGLIMNDGAAWWMMPLPNVLALFAELTGGDEPDPVEVEVISVYYDILYREANAPLCRGGMFVYPKEGLGSDWVPATIDHLTGEIATPEGKSVPADELERIVWYLKNVDEDDMVYDYSGLELIPPEKDAAPEEDESEAELTKEKKRFTLSKLPKLPKLKRTTLFRLLGILCVALLFALILFFAGNSGISKFNKALRAGDYQKAQTEYADFNQSKRSQADVELKKLPAELVQKYAAGEMSEAELAAHLSAIYKFPSATDEVETAVEVAAQLTASKQAYKAGLQAETASDTLSAWQGVIEADTASWEPTQKDATSHEGDYTAEIMAEIQEYQDCGLNGHAYKLAQTLVYWYPWNVRVMATVNELADYANEPDLCVPIEITEVKTSLPSASGYVDLSVLWTNVSAKSIEKVVFFVTPFDEFGNAVAKPYEAIDTKGYKPSEGVSSTNWGWAAAWKSAVIKNAVVTRVSVQFVDGVNKVFDL